MLAVFTLVECLFQRVDRRDQGVEQGLVAQVAVAALLDPFDRRAEHGDDIGTAVIAFFVPTPCPPARKAVPQMVPETPPTALTIVEETFFRKLPGRL